MMNIHNLSISFQGEYLFEDITFKLGNGDRIGLIGKNGAGKSTMLKILSKEMEPDTGQIAADKELKIGFLKQDIDFEYGTTILEEAYKAFEEMAPLHENITIDDVGNAAVFLGSDLSARTTGEIFYVDAGYSIMGVPNVE